jgi:hypothetical protein
VWGAGAYDAAAVPALLVRGRRGSMTAAWRIGRGVRRPVLLLPAVLVVVRLVVRGVRLLSALPVRLAVRLRAGIAAGRLQRRVLLLVPALRLLRLLLLIRLLLLVGPRLLLLVRLLLLLVLRAWRRLAVLSGLRGLGLAASAEQPCEGARNILENAHPDKLAPAASRMERRRRRRPCGRNNRDFLTLFGG